MNLNTAFIYCLLRPVVLLQIESCVLIFQSEDLRQRLLIFCVYPGNIIDLKKTNSAMCLNILYSKGTFWAILAFQSFVVLLAIILITNNRETFSCKV